MPEKYLRSMSRALWDSDLVASRLTLFLAEALWALMLMWPGETFDRPTYTAMAHVASEEAWALIFAASSVTQLSIVLMEDFHSRFARYFAAWNALLWGYVVIGMVLSVQPPPAAIGGEIALAVLAFWIFARPYALASIYGRAHAKVGGN